MPPMFLGAPDMEIRRLHLSPNRRFHRPICGEERGAMPGDDQVNTEGTPRDVSRSAARAERSRTRLSTEWVVIPGVIAAVFLIAFGVRFLFF
jgi:hypothetical protein